MCDYEDSPEDPIEESPPPFCFVCSKVIGDPKSFVQCVKCSGMFHAGCCGITDLRGLHMKRPTWKCPNCAAMDPIETEQARHHKRQRSDSGDYVAVDRTVLDELFDTMRSLHKSVLDIKSELGEVRKENQFLISKLSAIEKNNITKKQPVSSYANIAANQNRNYPRYDTIENVSTPVTSRSPPKVVNEQVMKVINNDNNLAGISPKDDFKPAPTRRRKIQKPIIIGQLEQEPQPSGSTTTSTTTFQSTERRHWIYVGRVKDGTSAETITDFVKSNWKIDDVLCSQLVSRDGICSFKVGVRESYIPNLLDPSKWPKGVAVREFVYIPKKGGSFGSKNGGGNFQQRTTQDMIT